MKFLIAAFAFAIATPAAAQPAAQQGHAGHGQGQHQGHGQGQRQGHGQSGHQGHGEGCPCCAPGPDGRRPACCERMHQQQGGTQAQPQGGGHDHH